MLLHTLHISSWFFLCVGPPFVIPVHAQQEQQDPLHMQGGSCLAMAGKDCVALLLDSRFGSGTQLVHVQARKVLMSPSLLLPSSSSSSRRNDSKFLVALQGLQGDVLELEHLISTTLQQQQQQQQTFGTLTTRSGDNYNSNNDMSARSLASWTSHVLYQRKQSPYFVEPIIAGLEPVDGVVVVNGKKKNQLRYRPYLASMDLLGALNEQPLRKMDNDDSHYDDDNNNNEEPYEPATFCCMGAAVPSLYGTAQAFWKPNMEAEELCRVCTKAFLAACERDCLSGYGARLYLLTPTDLTIYNVQTRND